MLLGLALAFWFSGCGQSATTGPEADKLRNDMERTLGELGKRAEPLLLKNDMDGLDFIFREKYQTAVEKGRPLTYGMAVLSEEGKVVAGRYPAPAGETHRKAKKGINFGQYDTFKKVLGGKASSCLLYTPQGTMYSVCIPLRDKRRVVGMVCVGYPEDDFKSRYKLDKDQFLAMSYD